MVGMDTIDVDLLAGVCGGMKWEQFRPSTNIEDRRGMSRYQSMHAHSPPAPPLPRLTRSPGDLPSQAGLDDVGRHGHHRR